MHKGFKEIKEKLILDDVFVFFQTAIKVGNTQIIDFILDYETFETLDFSFPAYKKANINNRYAARKLLDSGYLLGWQKFPNDWITEKVMEDFLDAQVEVYDQDVFVMDSSFLINEFDRKFKVRSKDSRILSYIQSSRLTSTSRATSTECSTGSTSPCSSSST
jgi:hypothetical protein